MSTHTHFVPVYHVCQCCNGAGCNVCADLVLIEGEIPDELGPDFDEINLDDWMDSNGVLHCSDTPINRVIGIKPQHNVFLDDRDLYSVIRDDAKERGEWEV